MPYVKRNSNGQIVAMVSEGDAEAVFVSSDDAEWLDFYSQGLSDDNPLYYLIKSDLDLTRVLDDLIDLLVQQGTIRFTDLPASAQRKLIERRKARSRLQVDNVGGMLLNDDEILKL